MEMKTEKKRWTQQASNDHVGSSLKGQKKVLLMNSSRTTAIRLQTLIQLQNQPHQVEVSL